MFIVVQKESVEMAVKKRFFQIRVTEEELKLIKDAAKVLDIDASEYVRKVVLPHASALLSNDEDKYNRVMSNLSSYMYGRYKVESDT